MIEMILEGASQQRIAQLSAFDALLAPALLDATGKSLEAVQSYAVDYMESTFMNPTGELEGAFYQVIELVGSSIEGKLINPSAYAWRRDRGFSGMTDSLGRYFPYDPGIEYAETALAAEIPAIEHYFSDAVGTVIAAVGA